MVVKNIFVIIVAAADQVCSLAGGANCQCHMYLQGSKWLASVASSVPILKFEDAFFLHSVVVDRAKW